MLTPTSIQIDKEFQDDGLFAITFYFEKDRIPYYITVCRDEYEEPDAVYVEAEDQIHSFKSSTIRYALCDAILTFDLSEDKENAFFWTRSKIVDIVLCQNDIHDVKICLERLFETGRQSGF